MRNFTRLMLIAFFSIVFMNVSGQNVGIKFGSVWSKANLKYDVAADEPDQQFLILPQLGVIFETPIYNGLFLQTGIMASVNGYRYDSKRMVEDESGNPVEVDSKERPILLYLSLPVDIGYKFMTGDKLGIFGMVGPVFRYLAYSTHTFKVNGEWDNESTDVEIGGEKKSMFKSFDFALNIEAGVQYDRWKFSLYYNPSFSNIFNDDIIPDGSDAQWKNYSFGVNVAVFFGPME
jgi:hypothetical protein